MEYIKLGIITNIKTGKLDANANSVNGKYPFFTCSRTPLKIDKYSYDCECVLVAGNGDLNVKYYNGKFDAYQRTYIIESNSENFNVKYLYYFLDKYVEILRSESIGGVIKYIKLENLTNAKLPKYNLNKQEMIVDNLTKVKNIIDYRKKQIEYLDTLIKSQFVEMFGNPINNEKNLKIGKIKDCLINIDNGTSFVCENFRRTNNYPAMLKLSSVTYGKYIQEENKALTNKEMFLSKNEVHKGDLLFTRKNTPELVGMSAYVYETEQNIMMPDLIFRLNTNERCNKIYLWKLINHPYFRNKIKAISNGSAKSMSNISKENLMNLDIVLPPIELQNQFAEIVKEIDKQKFEIEASLKETEILYETLMARYFE